MEVYLNEKIENLYFDDADPASKLYKISVDILISNEEVDDEIIGNIKLYTACLNLFNISSKSFEILDSHSQHLSDTFNSILDEDFEFNVSVFPTYLKEELELIDNLRILYIQDIVLKDSYRKQNLLGKIFAILKMQFNYHLFLLKPFPLQYSTKKHVIEYEHFNLPTKKTPLNSGIRNLVNVYKKQGFELLNVKTKEPYMVLLNYGV